MCICVRTCVRVCVSFHFYCQMSKPTTSFRSCYILWFPLVEPFFLDNIFTIYNLSRLCMLAANGFFFFGQVCLRLAWEVQYLVDRFGIHHTTASQTFIFLSRQFFHFFAKGSTHFLLSASTISFSVCTTVLYSCFYLF